MSKLYNTGIDLAKSEVQNAILQVLGSAPSTPAQGQMYYSSASHQPLWWDSSTSSWRNLATDSALLNAQNAAFYLARANHTGTQLAATISDFNTAVRLNRIDQLAAAGADVSLGGFKITNGAAPVSGTDFAIKQYVDDKVAGLSWKDEVQFATTANVSLSGGGLAAGTVIDGYTLVAGDRGLVKNQTTGSENGVYVVPSSGAASRATDVDTSAEIAGATMAVMNGTANGGQRYTLTTSGAIVLGTTSLSFGIFGGGTTYTFGNGLTGSTTISVLPDPVALGGIAVTSTGVKLDRAVAVVKFVADFGDGSTLSYPITHNLGTLDVIVRVYRKSDGVDVEVDVTRNSTNQVTVGVTTAPASNAYRIVVHG